MTKKDYVAMAKEIKLAKDVQLAISKQLDQTDLSRSLYIAGLRRAMQIFSDYAKSDNSKFDHDQFLAACGL